MISNSKKKSTNSAEKNHSEEYEHLNEQKNILKKIDSNLEKDKKNHIKNLIE